MLDEIVIGRFSGPTTLIDVNKFASVLMVAQIESGTPPLYRFYEDSAAAFPIGNLDSFYLSALVPVTGPYLQLNPNGGEVVVIGTNRSCPMPRPITTGFQSAICLASFSGTIASGGVYPLGLAANSYMFQGPAFIVCSVNTSVVKGTFQVYDAFNNALDLMGTNELSTNPFSGFSGTKLCALPGTASQFQFHSAVSTAGAVIAIEAVPFQ